ncbi:MAG: hypothetical protein ABIO71_09825 [Caldimonas sp.]
MNTASLPSPRAPGGAIASAARRFASASPALAAAGGIFLVTSALLLVAMALDGRQWQGASTWLKPWKFHFSIAVQLLTFALLAHAMAPEARRRASTRIWFGIAIAMSVFEAVYITVMGALNQGSHFNETTPALAALYTLMGVGAVLLSMSGAAIGVQIARFPHPGASSALRWGLALALVAGWLIGTLTGGYMGGQKNHWVGGLATDAGGLPLFGWSRSGGDLRVPHFAGVHATQAIALVAWLLQRGASSVAQMRWALLGTVLFAAFWAGLTLLLFVQASAGRPLLAG